MVSSILPGTTGAGALGVDTRNLRPMTPAQQRRDEPNVQGDRVELSAASLAAARESVRAGVAEVHEALALGHEAQAMLVKVQALAKSGDQGELDATLAQYAAKLDAAEARGARVAAGQDIAVQAEPGGAPVTISGVDLRLGGAVIVVSAGAQAADAGLAAQAQSSLDALQGEMSKLLESARALEAHQGFLGAAELAMGVRGDLDADSARLLALQVRQGLQAAGAASIANAEPQAVLSLFRA
ncbi:MAG: hypothetical protein AB7Q23_17530 [Hyphomonadaceae bacterium]